MTGYDGYLLASEFVRARASEPHALAFARDRQDALKRWCAHARTLGPASPYRALLDVALYPVLDLLGFEVAGPAEVATGHVRVSARAAATKVAVIVTTWGAPLAAFWREAVTQAVRTGAAWCLLCNGTHLRLVHASRLQSRRHAEIDLEAAADDLLTASALWLLFRAEALVAPEGHVGVAQLIAEADDHATGVCRSLRAGVLEASSEVLRALVARERGRPVPDVFEQSLTVVYRPLFLFFAEARALVPLWHPVYRESYSVHTLRDAALTSEATGLWDALRAVARLAHAGCQAGGLNVTPFNGRLFSPSRTPLAERRGLDDDAARRAIVALSTRPARDGTARERISYRDLGVEQLGAVYETLLDYEPRVERGPRGRLLRVSLEPGSGVRKATGTFYTPQPIVEYLVRNTLSPLVRDATPEAILGLRVLDPSMGSGAFLVGACRFLAAAYETALIDHGRCHATDIGPGERASMHRLVAERCLFGVDINPTAVQLARLSLWLTTLAADRPLTFLDHHLRCGDSLAGTWIACLRTSPIRRMQGGTLPLFPDAAQESALAGALPVRFRLAEDPNDTPAQVRAKERALAALAKADTPLARWTRIADLWCAGWLADPPVPAAAYAELADAILTCRSALPRGTQHSLLDRVAHTARAQRLFHWELEFPEVFFDEHGRRRADAGFDAVLGNPPWDMVRADGAGDRTSARAEAARLVRFARESGVYEVRPGGQVNRYQLFTERAIALTRPGGRIGLVLPSGIVADSGSAPVRRLLFSRTSVDHIVGFDNRAGTFPIHRSVRFVLLSATAGGATREMHCRFGETNAASLPDALSDGGDRSSWYPLRVSPALLHKISGEDLSVPDARTPVDLALVERAAEICPALGAADGWQVHFGRELNATEDSDVLRQHDAGLPVLEGKLIEPFRARVDLVRWRIAPDAAAERIGPRAARPRLAYRDVASATNRVTLIAALLPAHTASTHTLFCLKEELPLDAQQVLCALFNSLVVNFFVRMRVSIHVTTSIVERLPVPTADRVGPWWGELAEGAALLSREDAPHVFARLNAIVAKLYALDAAEFGHVLATFPLIDRSDRDAMMRAFEEL